MQLSLIPEEAPVKLDPLLRNIGYGIPLLRSNGTIIVKVKPTGPILNSHLVTDVLNRGDCFIFDLAKGTLYFVSGNESAIVLKNCKLHYSLPLL